MQENKATGNRWLKAFINMLTIIWECQPQCIGLQTGEWLNKSDYINIIKY